MLDLLTRLPLIDMASNKSRLDISNAEFNLSGAIFLVLSMVLLGPTSGPYLFLLTLRNFVMLNFVPLLLATRLSPLSKQGHFGYNGSDDIRLTLVHHYSYPLTSVDSRTGHKNSEWVCLYSTKNLRLMKGSPRQMNRSKRNSGRSLYIFMEISSRNIIHLWTMGPTNGLARWGYAILHSVNDT